MHTVCRYLHKNGNGYYQSRKRGLITTNDKSIRLAFAKRYVNTQVDFLTKQIAFYFDRVSFGTGGKTVSLFVGISYGRGVVLNEKVEGTTTGESFAKFVRNFFILLLKGP